MPVNTHVTVSWSFRLLVFVRVSAKGDVAAGRTSSKDKSVAGTSASLVQFGKKSLERDAQPVSLPRAA